MSRSLRVYVNGAYLPRYVVDGAVNRREVWRLGNFLLTDEALELSTKAGRLTIPVGSVTAVKPPQVTFKPPFAGLDQCLAIHHKENGKAAVTLLAFPRVTVQNFPLQLAAALTGTVDAYLPQGGTGPAARYEKVAFRLFKDRFLIQRRVGLMELPLERVTSVSPSRRTDSKGREFVEWVLGFVESEDTPIRTVTMLSYDRLPFLWSLLACVRGMRKGGNVAQDLKVQDQLDERAEQVTVMLYTGGMDAAGIGQALGLDADTIDEIYEDLLRRGFASVVKTRKEVKLTSAGAKLVDEIIKRQLDAAN